MAEALIRAVDRSVISRKGDVIQWRANGSGYGKEEGLPRHIIIKIPDATLQEMDLQFPARHVVSRKVVSITWQADRPVMVITNENAGANKGKLTHSNAVEVESALGGTIQNERENEATIGFELLDMVRSQVFLGFNTHVLAGFVISLVSSDGSYVFDLDHSASGVSPTDIERTIYRHTGATIISHVSKVVRFSLTKTDIENTVRRRIADLPSDMIQKHRYRLPAALVDSIVSQGGVYEVDKGTFFAGLIDKRDE